MLKKLVSLLPLGLLLALAASTTAFAGTVNPQTGDNSMIGVILVVLGVSAVVVVALLVMNAKKKKR